jgi:integrase
MASVRKYPSSRYWIGIFYDASGRQFRRTTRETTRARAQLVANQFERAAKSRGSVQRVRQTLNEFLREHYADDIESVSVKDFCAGWLSARQTETAPGTHRRYKDTLAKFLAFLGPRASRSLDSITKDQLTAFRDSQVALSAPATVNHALKIVRMVFRAARRDGLLFVDPAEGVRFVKHDDSFRRRPFSLHEVRSILEVANDEWRSLILFGIYTGQRLGDLCTLTWAQIDLQRSEIAITQKKTGKRLLVPIARPLYEHLLSRESGDDARAPVHPYAFGVFQKEGRVGSLSNQFAEILVDAGLRSHSPHSSRGVGRSSKRVGTELSFHSLRHTAVSLLKDAGVPDAVVQALVGHESAAMSHRYTHVGKEALSRATGSLPEL